MTKPLSKPLRELLSLHDRWNCYIATTEESLSDGKKQQSSTTPQLVFTMHRSSALQSSSDQAEIHMGAATTSAASSSLSCKHPAPAPSFQIEGSFSRRNCKIRGSDGKAAAKNCLPENADRRSVLSAGDRLI
ncbi:hypothetical protein EJB05_29782, partial [Eragrostis curvula]